MRLMRLRLLSLLSFSSEDAFLSHGLARLLEVDAGFAGEGVFCLSFGVVGRLLL